MPQTHPKVQAPPADPVKALEALVPPALKPPGPQCIVCSYMDEHPEVYAAALGALRRGVSRTVVAHKLEKVTAEQDARGDWRRVMSHATVLRCMRGGHRAGAQPPHRVWREVGEELRWADLLLAAEV